MRLCVSGDIEQASATNGETDWVDIVEKQKCIFCNRRFRKYKSSYLKLTTTTLSTKKNQILHILSIMNEQQKLIQFENDPTICYHTLCLSELEYKHVKSRTPKKATTKSHQTDWASRRSSHFAAFTKIATIITETLIEKGAVRTLSDIYGIYQALWEEEKIRFPTTSDTVFRSQHLLKKILEQFPTLTKTVYNNRIFVHRSDLSLLEIYEQVFDVKEDCLNQIKSVAFHIRQCVMNMDKRPLPKKNITLRDILGGECDIPRELSLLIGSLIKGPNGSKSAIKETKIECICHSIMLCMSNGVIKPATSIHLGMATKSLTGSRKMVDILNRMGFSISYTIVEELETELAYGYSMQKRTLPDGLIPNCPELRTHLAFDNYDRYVETSSGKDTLHDTVGIVYQNMVGNMQIESVQSCPESETRIDLQSGTRRRNYQSHFDASVQPYFRRNEIAPALIGNSPALPTSLEKSISLDMIWIFQHALGQNNKRWFAWNSERTADPNPMQKIGYLPNINMSPTADATVKKTLEVAQCVAKDCGQQNIIVTYDLAIACKAYKIKTDLSPNFDNVFITLGAFHTELSYFKVSGIQNFEFILNIFSYEFFMAILLY